MRKSIVILALVVVGVLVTATALRLLDDREPSSSTTITANQTGEPPEGAIAKAGISGIVEYTVRDPNGQVRDHAIIHNTVNAEGLNDVLNMITSTGNGDYDGIAAMATSSFVDNPSDGVAASSIALALDGDSTTAGDQNPADGTVSTDFGNETGNGSVAVTFTATTSGTVTIRQIVLTRSSEDNTLLGGAAAITDANIFAYVDVPDISLGTNDTVTYTWTVDVD